jgi:hypothetical protein
MHTHDARSAAEESKCKPLCRTLLMALPDPDFPSRDIPESYTNSQPDGAIRVDLRGFNGSAVAYSLALRASYRQSPYMSFQPVLPAKTCHCLCDFEKGSESSTTMSLILGVSYSS